MIFCWFYFSRYLYYLILVNVGAERACCWRKGVGSSTKSIYKNITTDYKYILSHLHYSRICDTITTPNVAITDWSFLNGLRVLSVTKRVVCTQLQYFGFKCPPYEVLFLSCNILKIRVYLRGFSVLK